MSCSNAIPDVACNGSAARFPILPRHLSLHPPEPADLRFITHTLDRECRKLGGSRGVRAVAGSGSLLLQMDDQAEEGGRREE